MEMIMKLATPVFAGLVLLTNIITESIKKVKEGVNAKAVALCTAIILSICVSIAGAFYLGLTIWYYLICAIIVGVILGFIVAQVAEAGYDGTYMQIVDILKLIIQAILGTKNTDDESESEDLEQE